MSPRYYFAILILSLHTGYSQPKIDRRALVTRHNVSVTSADSLSSLSVGNGRFAFTVDVTGLQTFPAAYANGVPLGTESEWGWHSFIDTAAYRREEALHTYHLNGRDITYLVEVKSPERNRAAANWFRQNPHRLQLGNLGFEIMKGSGAPAQIQDIKDVKQELNLWTGEITSRFTVEGTAVTVSTLCDQQSDAIAVQVKSALLKINRQHVVLRLPYPTGEWTDVGTNYRDADKHVSRMLTENRHGASILHQLDSTRYYVDFAYDNARLSEGGAHQFRVVPDAGSNVFSFTCRFSQWRQPKLALTHALVRQHNIDSWNKFWNGGAAVDFTGSTDRRAAELERRVVLSQYLIKIQEAGANPPQETGLTYNSWFGKPHMEMPYWHLGHYPFWGHASLLDSMMQWYVRAAPKARELAARQGFDGLRWPKVTDNTGDETPSSVGAFLLWDQPHLIYFAESIYRQLPSSAFLNRYKDLVFGTAEFMASFPWYEKEKDRYILGKGVIPAQERFPAEETFNPTYELVYWKWALVTAQRWRERLHLSRNEKWDSILQKLSALPVQDDKYLAAESAIDSYTNPRYKTDHPSVLMALGCMPATGQVDQQRMKNTFDWIWDHWSWNETWGWDFPMVAMTATRLGLPDRAMDALFMPVQTNTYLVNGHNYQNARLRLYLPGNGALLSAIALMCAGYDGCVVKNPGIPRDGKWKVKWEGLTRLP